MMSGMSNLHDPLDQYKSLMDRMKDEDNKEGEERPGNARCRHRDFTADSGIHCTSFCPSSAGSESIGDARVPRRHGKQHKGQLANAYSHKPSLPV